MRKTPLLAAVIFAATVSGAPEFAAAMGSNNPTPPQSSKPSGSIHQAKDQEGQKHEFCGRSNTPVIETAGVHPSYA